MKERREETPLLFEEPPAMSELPPRREKAALDPQLQSEIISKKQQTGKTWRKRLFGAKKLKQKQGQSDAGQVAEDGKALDDEQSHSNSGSLSTNDRRKPNSDDADFLEHAGDAEHTNTRRNRQRADKRDDSTESTNATSNQAGDELQIQRHLKHGRASNSQSNTQSQITSRPSTESSQSSKKSRNSHRKSKTSSKTKPSRLEPQNQSQNHAKDLLARPFGRTHVNSDFISWSVQVSPAEWEPEERVWKYRIAIKKRELKDGNDAWLDYVNGTTFRSLSDFCWLENALLAEYHGSLLLPSLAITLGVPALENTQHEVDSQRLSEWFSDILNGVRGQGELFLKSKSSDLVSSESLETFLYRSTMPMSPHHSFYDALPIMSPPQSPQADEKKTEDESEDPSNLWKYLLPDICSGGVCSTVETPPRVKIPKIKMPNCTSQALGNAASFGIQDSLVEAASLVEGLPGDHAVISSLALRSDVLQAERDLVWSWRAKALVVVEKCQALQEQEKLVGAAWKRFAISVSNLFAYEKDVEAAKLGDSKSKREMHFPYRKLQKNTVDDCLRILARQKFERCTPALESVHVMLNAYVADLSAVDPSVQAYLNGVKQLTTQRLQLAQALKDANPASSSNSTDNTAKPSTLADHLKVGLLQVHKQITTPLEEELRSSERARSKQRENNALENFEQQLQQYEQRVVDNEGQLRQCLTTFCKATPVRVARIAYRFLNDEVRQCTMLQSSSMEMRSKIAVATKESLSKMITRHRQELTEDRAKEMELVKRLLNIGNNKRYGSPEEEPLNHIVKRGGEMDSDVQTDEARRAELHEHALKRSQERFGRWDSRVALAIMEAIGVKDANVRVEETTRDLRMVRKYAIGLREHVQRCIEAHDILRMSILQSGSGDVRHLRRNFIVELNTLVSATYQPSASEEKRKPSPNIKSLLKGMDIDLNDPSGWTKTTKGSCGEAVSGYMESRESGAEWFLETLGRLLQEYNERIEAIENFVYMDCVGIQLEKHFSQVRAKALAAFEKKTDITSAINIATRKRMPMLVHELQAKLEAVGQDVSHTTVKESKEAHLESKVLKTGLHELAVRRLTRARETSTERVIALMTVWTKEEENAASKDLRILKEVIECVENAVGLKEFEAYRYATTSSSPKAEI